MRVLDGLIPMIGYLKGVSKMLLGETVKTARKIQGKTALQVGNDCGRHQTSIGRIEQGRSWPRSQGLIQRLAFSLNLDWVDLARMVDDERSLGKIEPDTTTYRATLRRYRSIEEKAHYVAKHLHDLRVQTGCMIPVITSHKGAASAGNRLGIPLWFNTYPWGNRNDPEGRVAVCGGGVFVELREDVAQRANEGHGRARFTAAHGLGHALLHRYELSTHTPMYEDRAQNTDWPPYLRHYVSADWQANTFAETYLMPLEGVLAFLAHQSPNRFQMEDLACHFGVTLRTARARMNKILPRLAKWSQS